MGKALKQDINDFMQSMPEQWRMRWCDAGICGCLGAANCSGGLLAHGFTKEDWEKWKIKTGHIDIENNNVKVDDSGIRALWLKQ